MRWLARALLRGGLGLAVGVSLSGCGTELALGRRGSNSSETPATLPQLEGPTRCGSQSPEAAVACVEEPRLRASVARIARPRPTGSAQHQAIRDHCSNTLRALGFAVEVQVYKSGSNVIGRKLGFSRPDEAVVLGAHYDQREGCAGADDNASGVAATLEAARVLAPGRYDRTLEVACWDEGERGWHGSAAHAAKVTLERRTRLAVVFDSVAFTAPGVDTQTIPEGFERLWPDQALALLEDEYRAHFLTLVTDSGAASWAEQGAALARKAELTTHVLLVSEAVKQRQQAMHRADHSSFWAAKVPALLLTDTGRFRNPAIGCVQGQDAPQSLDFGFLTVATRAGLAVVVTALQPR